MLKFGTKTRNYILVPNLRLSHQASEKINGPDSILCLCFYTSVGVAFQSHIRPSPALHQQQTGPPTVSHNNSRPPRCSVESSALLAASLHKHQSQQNRLCRWREVWERKSRGDVPAVLRCISTGCVCCSSHRLQSGFITHQERRSEKVAAHLFLLIFLPATPQDVNREMHKCRVWFTHVWIRKGPSGDVGAHL